MDSGEDDHRQPTDFHERSGPMQAATIAKKPRKQAISGRFWAGRTYRGRIKDDHKIDAKLLITIQESEGQTGLKAA